MVLPPMTTTSEMFNFIAPWFRAEIVLIIKLASPMMLISMVSYIMVPICLIFCGHLDKMTLGGVALALTIINSFGFMFGMGLCTALDTLLSQAFGANNTKMVGIYLQRGIVIAILFYIAMLVLYINVTPIIIAFGHSSEIAGITGNFVMIFTPGMFFNFIYQVLTKYLYHQNITFPCIIIGLVGCVVNIIFHAALVYYANLGSSGSAIALDLSFFAMTISTLSFIVLKGMHKGSLTNWSLAVLEDWGPFCALAVPGIFMLVIEWGCFEIGIFLAGIIDIVQMDAQAIAVNIDGFAYQIPYGLSMAANIRIGQLIGKNDASAAKNTCCVVIIVAVLIACVYGPFYALLRYQLPRIFTNQTAVIQWAAEILPILSVYTLFNCIQCVCAGVLRACGRQFIGSIFIFVSYFVLALPIGIPLMFMTSLGVKGFWLGITAGIIFLCVCLLLIISKTDWIKQEHDAIQRTNLAYSSVKFEDMDDLEDDETLTSNDETLSSNDETLTSNDETLTSNVSRSEVRWLLFKRGWTVACLIAFLSIGIIIRLNFHGSLKLNHVETK